MGTLFANGQSRIQDAWKNYYVGADLVLGTFDGAGMACLYYIGWFADRPGLVHLAASAPTVNEQIEITIATKDESTYLANNHFYPGKYTITFEELRDLYRSMARKARRDYDFRSSDWRHSQSLTKCSVPPAAIAGVTQRLRWMYANDHLKSNHRRWRGGSRGLDFFIDLARGQLVRAVSTGFFADHAQYFRLWAGDADIVADARQHGFGCVSFSDHQISCGRRRRLARSLRGGRRPVCRRRAGTAS